MSNYIGNTPGFGQGQTFIYTLTGGQSSVSGPDALGRTLAYTPGLPMIVAYNGALQSSITDYTATNGTSITFNGWTANAGDELVVIAFAAFALADTLKPSNNLSDLVDPAAARVALLLGTAATLNFGTAANQLVRLDGSARLPAVDGSLLTGIVGGAPILNTQSFTANGTWTKPGVGTWALVVGVGGGGGGGSGSNNAGSFGNGGTGGGSGAASLYLFRLADLGATETVTIGAGGNGSTTVNTAGSPGSDSLFGSLCVFSGGFGGGGGSASPSTGTNCGSAGGGGGLTGSVGQTNGFGGVRSNASFLGLSPFLLQPGGGGGGGGRNSTPAQGNGAAGGVGNLWFGTGGTGGNGSTSTTPTAGTNATGAGAGGGGGGSGFGVSANGGNGTRGEIRAYVF